MMFLNIQLIDMKFFGFLEYGFYYYKLEESGTSLMILVLRHLWYFI